MLSPLRRRAGRRLREPFGKAGLTVAILALVMALVGGAYAAGGLTKSQEKQVTKIAKKYAGKPGATGPAGPAGTNGTNGKDGAPGTKGTNGENVAVSAYAGEECEESPGEAGAEFTNGTGTAFACNGKEGSPWTAGGTLPSKQSEYGTFAYYGNKENGAIGASPISFTLPLAKEAKGAEFLYKGQTGTNCKGTAKEPTAPPGYLCVYDVVGEEEFGKPTTGKFIAFNKCESFGGGGNAGLRGAVLIFETQEIGSSPIPFALAEGTWAVTAQ